MATHGAEHLRAPVLTLVRSVGVATVVPVIVGVVSAPMLARAMHPQDRGHLAGVLAACTIATVLALGGSAQRLPKALAGLPIESVWNLLIGEARRLLTGLMLFSAGLAVIATIVWPDSRLQLGLIVAVVVVSWGLGMVRGTFVGIHHHASATTSFLIESLVRGGAIIAIALAWGHVGPSLALLMTGLIPPLLTCAWASPRIRNVRALADEPASPSTISPVSRGSSPVRIALAQQFMGRSILAVWAITLSEGQVGFVVVAFAMTELTVNFARIAQPHVIHQAESGHPRAAPWMVAIGVATLASAAGGLLVIAPLFGAAYSDATQVVVPLALAQGLFAASIVMTGLRFVSDGDGAIRSIQYWMAATVVVTTLIGVGGSAVLVTVAFAVMALGQAATGAAWLRRLGHAAPSGLEAHAA